MSTEYFRLIAQIEGRGWIVKAFGLVEYCELQAVRLPDGADVKIARCGDGDGPASQLQAAIMLDAMTLDISNGPA